MSAFWADVLVAEGLVVRQWDSDSDDYRYFDALHPPDKKKPPAPCELRFSSKKKPESWA